MQLYVLLLALLGGTIILTGWLPMLIRELPLSLPIVCIGLGCLFVWIPFFPDLTANPLESRSVTERLTEFVVIVSLMGAGLKLDRAVGWRGWNATWRLLGISMPLTIAAIALLGWGLLGLDVAAALLLGAVLAPTDPVLASDVQLGPPGSGGDDEMRFTLTSEAGLNDGLAFPFVFLAIGWALWEKTGQPFLADWLLVDVLWKVPVGVLVGWVGGKATGYLAFQLPNRVRMSHTGDGLVALGLTIMVYGLTEIVHGYGFLAVFVAAVSLRSVERQSRYHEELHSFSEQIERLLMLVLLVCFGAAIAEGSVFGALNGAVVVASLLILFVVRPLAGWIGLLGFSGRTREKAVIAFFGIRGLGSFYYLAFALGQAEFGQANILWVTVCCVVLLSIFVHGVTVTPVMRWVDRASRSGS